MNIGGKKRDVEISPKPRHEEHHFGGYEEDHAVAKRKLHDRRMIPFVNALVDDIAPPGEHGYEDTSQAGEKYPRTLKAEDSTRAGLHPDDCADGHYQRRYRPDDGPRTRLKQMIVVMFDVVVSHGFLRDASGRVLARILCFG